MTDRDPSAVDADVADRKREARQNVLLQVSVYRFVVGACVCVCVCARVSVLREIQWEGLFAASLPKPPRTSPPRPTSPPKPNLSSPCMFVEQQLQAPLRSRRGQLKELS